jgi:hypothetical protein
VRFGLAAALTLAVATVSGCGDAEPAQPPASIGTEAEPVVEVETARVRRGSILQRISAPGSLVAKRESRLGPEVRGRIAKIMVQEGDRVAEGDPLFQIDPEPYELALRQAQARHDRARAEREQLKEDLARGRKLRSQEILAEQRLDQLGTSLEVARAAEREAGARGRGGRRPGPAQPGADDGPRPLRRLGGGAPGGRGHHGTGAAPDHRDRGAGDLGARGPGDHPRGALCSTWKACPSPSPPRSRR